MKDYVCAAQDFARVGQMHLGYNSRNLWNGLFRAGDRERGSGSTSVQHEGHGRGMLFLDAYRTLEAMDL
jgi:hypothetical protein